MVKVRSVTAVKSTAAVFLRRLSFHLRGVLGDELQRVLGRPPEKRSKKKAEAEAKGGQEVNSTEEEAGAKA